MLVLERLPESGIRLHHWNNDGRRTDFCLNGSRCAIQLAATLGLAAKDDYFLLRTDAGDIAGRRVDDNHAELRLPALFAGVPEACALEVDGERHEGFLVRVGVPHFVLPWPAGLAAAPVAELSPRLRHHEDLGAGGANVNFVRWTSGQSFEIRTFERGIEGETLACGSGVVASFRVGRAIEALNERAEALTSGGFRLALKEDESGRGSLEIAGDARLIAHGELLPGARVLPERPSWSR